MALTRDFKATVGERIARDAAFRSALLGEAAGLLLDGDLEAGKRVLRDFVNATVGFEQLSGALGMSPKSVMRMLGPKGNPTAANLLAILTHLRQATGIRLEVTTFIAAA